MPARAARGSADVLWAAIVAGTLSGLPSTVHAMAVGDSLLASTRAAGTILGRPTVLRGLVVHSVISLGWTVVLARTLPRRRTVFTGAVAGGGIAVLALGGAGRRLPAIRALPVGPQVLDHLAFGALVGTVLHHRAAGLSGPSSAHGGDHTAPTVPAPEWAPRSGRRTGGRPPTVSATSSWKGIRGVTRISLPRGSP